MIVMRPATRADVERVSTRLRVEDSQEIRTVAGGASPQEVIRQVFIYTNHVFAGWVGDYPVCLFGMTPDAPGKAAIWLVATPEVTKVSLSLVREGRQWLKAWSQQFKLYNMVDQRNELHVKWIKLMGFDLHHTVEINGFPFTHFEYP